MNGFVRVKDKTTGHKYSVRHPDPERVEVLKDELAVDSEGRTLPPEVASASAPVGGESDKKAPVKKAAAKRSTSKRSTTKSTAATKAAASTTPTPGAESATTPEEGSAS